MIKILNPKIFNHKLSHNIQFSCFNAEKNSTIPIAIATPYLKDKNAIEINFLKEALQLEIKNILTSKNIITITSFQVSKEHLFYSKNLIIALQKQKRKVLIIDSTSELKELNNETNYINLNDNKFLELKKEFKVEVNQPAFEKVKKDLNE